MKAAREKGKMISKSHGRILNKNGSQNKSYNVLKKIRTDYQEKYHKTKMMTKTFMDKHKLMIFTSKSALK